MNPEPAPRRRGGLDSLSPQEQKPDGLEWVAAMGDAQAEAARARAEEALLRYESTLQQAFREVEDALVAGICAMGVDVIQVGPMPTPAMAFLTADMCCDAGVGARMDADGMPMPCAMTETGCPL